MDDHGEVKRLVVDKKYSDFVGYNNVPIFVIEPCVGGMVLGVQRKWRVRYNIDEVEKVLVVINDVPFVVANGEFIIKYSEKNNQKKQLIEGYGIYSISH